MKEQETMMNIVITNMINEETVYSVSDANELIIAIETNLGVEFNTVDLFSEESRLTKSMRCMETELTDGMHLFITLSDKPVRVMDKNINDLWSALSLSEQEDAGGSVWIAYSTILEDTFGPIEEWDVSFITSMAFWFSGTTEFNRDISKWNVSRVKDFACMFSCAEAFNQDIRGWDVSNATDFTDMFIEAEEFDQDLSGWKVKKNAIVINMFNRCYNCHDYSEAIRASWGDDIVDTDFFYDSDDD